MKDADLDRRFRLLIEFIMPPNGILSWTTTEVGDLFFYGLNQDIILDIDKLRTYSYYRDLIKPIVLNLFGTVTTNTHEMYEVYKRSPSVFMVLLHAILKTHGKRELMPKNKTTLRIPDDYETMMIENMTEVIKPLCYDNIYIIQNNTTTGLITARFTLPYTSNISKSVLNILKGKYRIDIGAQEIINIYDIAAKILLYSLYDAIFVVLHLIYAFYEYSVFYNYGGKDPRHKVRGK
jgi:hypothetical protein